MKSRKSFLILSCVALTLLAGTSGLAAGPAGDYNLHLPTVFQEFERTGALTGVVTSAATGLPIESAVVCVAGTTDCAITDPSGGYTLSGAPVGLQGFDSGAFGFFTASAETIIGWEQTTTLDFVLSPSLVTGKVRIELTWATARDLDAHLWLPETLPVHIFWNNLGRCLDLPYACLDKDDFAFGPETMEIRQRFPGTYVYGVYLFDTGNLINSAPVVRIYDDNGLLAERQVPQEGHGRWWYVFDLDGITGNITPVDTISNTSPGPYDPAPDESLPSVTLFESKP